MKIAIISDTHDNLANLKKAISWLEKEKIKLLLHCGDIASIETIKVILENFFGKIYIVLGNMDKNYFSEKELNSFKNHLQLEIKNELNEIEINNRKIAFTHFPEIAKELAEKQRYDIVFYGHTHKPWEEKIGKTKLVNPGNLAGIIFKATFAIYDSETDKLELKILETFD
jgi:putative phosphoesterase